MREEGGGATTQDLCDKTFWFYFQPPRALFGHWDNNPNVLYHISSGTGGAEDLAQQVDKAQYQYAIGELYYPTPTPFHKIIFHTYCCWYNWGDSPVQQLS